MIKLQQCDCLELMKDIPDTSIDMILCDLPYGTTRNKKDARLPFEPLWEIYKRNGIMLCNPKPMHAYHFLNLPEVQKHIVSRGFDLQQEVVAPVDLVQSNQLKTVSYGYARPFWL